MSNERLTELETKLAFLEHANQEMSDLVYAQQQQLDKLDKYCHHLAKQLRSLGQTDDPANPADEVPPHY